MAFGAFFWAGWGEAQKEAQEGQKHNSKQARSTILFAVLQLSNVENGPEHATVGIFAVFRCENGPEHDAVGILATFKAKTGPTHGPLGKF